VLSANTKGEKMCIRHGAYLEV